MSSAAWKFRRTDPVDLRTYIESAIEAQNLLQLPPHEIKSMTTLLIEAKTKKEIFDWSATLMLGDVFAAEVIKRRQDLEELPELSHGPSELSGARATAGSRKYGKRGGRKGKAISASTELVEGALFECGCFATTHVFKSNCANCGRIFCQQESDETCYFCGLDPAKCIAHEVRVETGKIDAAAEEKNQKEIEEALLRRNQLLQYARERTKRTTVIDDQSGQFCASAWASKQENEAALEVERQRVAKLHRETGAYVVHVDIAKQAISLGAVAPVEPDPASTAETTTQPEASDGSESADGQGPSRIVVMPNLLQKIWYRDEKDKSGNKKEKSCPVVGQIDDVFSVRVQNDYFEGDDTTWCVAKAEHALFGQVEPSFIFAPTVLDVPEAQVSSANKMRELSAPIAQMLQTPSEDTAADKYCKTVPRPMRHRDDRRVISLHQPWASLVVAGIKRHEGRTWPTDYRGRLWIHAAASPPSRVEEVEHHYRAFVPEATKFPSIYPTRCLLGCVYMLDCLSMKTYSEVIPVEERSESSEYVFILAEPTRLQFPLAMDGGPKIFQLEKKLWLAAQRQLETGAMQK